MALKFLCILVFGTNLVNADYDGYYWNNIDKTDYRIPQIHTLLNSSYALIRDTEEQIDRMATLRLNSLRSIPFEVGYLIYNIQEEYRRMVDKYNTCVTVNARLYYHEYMIYLEDIEYHFWKIEHLANMLHEVERKYTKKGKTLQASYENFDANFMPKPTTTSRATTRIHIQANPESTFTLSATQKSILNDVSWDLKIRFIKNLIPLKVNSRLINIQPLILSNKKQNRNNLINNAFTERNTDVQASMLREKNVRLAKQLKRNVAVDFLKIAPRNVVNQRIEESAMSFEEKSQSKDIDFKAMGVHDGLQTDHNIDNQKYFHFRRAEAAAEAKDDEVETERDMKLKVFRLMYDTVKDNDEMVAKADKIKKKYDNSSYFELGFIMGAITDKVNTMTEVALTVERLYNQWKPIEHVNAYEQIANQAIEITHLIDLLESANRKAKKAEAKKAEAQKAEAQKAEAQKAEAQKAEAQKAEAQKAEAQKAEAQKAEAQKAEAQKAEAQKAEANKDPNKPANDK